MLLPAIPQAYLTLWGAEACGVACPINHLLNADHIANLINASGANLLVALGPHAELDIWSRVPGLLRRCPALRQVLAVGGAPGVRSFAEALALQTDTFEARASSRPTPWRRCSTPVAPPARPSWRNTPTATSCTPPGVLRTCTRCARATRS